MATKHAANTEKRNQTGRKQAAEKHQDVQAEVKQKKPAAKQKGETKAKQTEQHSEREEQVEHRDERDFVGQMDGAQANKEMEGQAPYDRSKHEHFDRPEDVREHEKSKAGSLPVENEHRARDHAGRRHQ